jgi:hypothetical protein
MSYAPDETGTHEAALRGVEPDEIDYDDSDDRAETPGVEPDEIDYDESDDGTETSGVEPDEIDHDESDDRTETPGVEPDEIDVYVSANAARAAQGTKPKTLVTYGPVITIKPKG